MSPESQRYHIKRLALLSRILLLAPFVSLGVYIYMFFGKDIPSLNPHSLFERRNIDIIIRSGNRSDDFIKRENQWNDLRLRGGSVHGLSSTRIQWKSHGNAENVLREPLRKVFYANPESTVKERSANKTDNVSSPVYKLIEFGENASAPGKKYALT